MDPHRTYDYLCRARAKIFDWVRPHPAPDYTKSFAIGPGSLARTLTHMYISEWYYVERMLGRDVPEYAHWPVKDEHPPGFPELESLWRGQEERTRDGLRSVRDWAAPIEYRITNDHGAREIITTSAADIFTQLALHEVHHRAQVMNMLRQLGTPAEDIDFNTMMYARRPAGE